MSQSESIPEQLEKLVSEEKFLEEVYVEDEELARDVDIRKEMGGRQSEENPSEFLKFDSANGNDRELASLNDNDTQKEKDKSVKNFDQPVVHAAVNANDTVEGIADTSPNNIETEGVNTMMTTDWKSMGVGVGSYDNYLLDKLLHSKAELSDELTEPDGFERPPMSVLDDVIMEEDEFEEEEGKELMNFSVPPELTKTIQEEPSTVDQKDTAALINTAEETAEGEKNDTASSHKAAQVKSPAVSPPRTPPGSPVTPTSGPCQITVTGTDGATVAVADTELLQKEIGTENQELKTNDEEPQRAQGDEEFLRMLEEELGVLKDDEEDEDSEKDDEIKEPEIVISESDEDDEDEDENEEEESDTMTMKQKKAVVKAVRKGSIDLLEDLLDKRNADMNMLWFNENLLMVAIRARQREMAEFLIDNGWDYNHTTSIMDATDGYRGPVKFYEISCRQMAYDRGMESIVELIDTKNGNLFPGIKPMKRNIRIRRPRPPTPPTPSEDTDDEISYTEDGNMCKIEMVQQEEGEGKRRRKRERDIDSGVQSFRTAELEDTTNKEPDGSEHLQDGGCDGAETDADSDHVYGMDEGYETMSPFSPFHERMNHSLISPREHVNVRITKASASVKMQTYRARQYVKNSVSEMERTEPVHFRPVRATGSYVNESKQWHRKSSASAKSSVDSVESIPGRVRVGRPWVHGTSNKTNTGSKQSVTQAKPVTSTRTALSPYSQVAKLLSESRLLDPTSATSPKMFPAVPSERVYRQSSCSFRTNTNYSYPKKSSSFSREFTTTRAHTFVTQRSSDLLPRRKLKSN